MRPDNAIFLRHPATPVVRPGTSRTVLSGISLLLLVAFALHPGVGGSGGGDRAWTVGQAGNAQRMVVQTPRVVERRVVRKQTERPALAGVLVLTQIARFGDREPMAPTVASPVRAMLPVWCTDLPPPLLSATC